MVVGTTPDGTTRDCNVPKEAAERKGRKPALWHLNFSLGVQMMLKLSEMMTKELAGLDYQPPRFLRHITSRSSMRRVERRSRCGTS